MNYHCRILITNLLWSTCAHFKGYMGGWHLQYRVDSHSTFSCILLHTEIDHPFTCPLLFHSCKPLKFTPVVGTVDKWAGEERPGKDLLEPLRLSLLLPIEQPKGSFLFEGRFQLFRTVIVCNSM